MSKDYHICWPAHPNIYNNGSSRVIDIYFSEPEKGVSGETGILLFIAGFGGNANSNVYKKMRTLFANKYNLVTIQCDYFGQEFMQESKSVSINFQKDELQNIFSGQDIEEIYSEEEFNINAFIEKGKKYSIKVSARENLKESISNFNEMGILQAIDNITAVNYVLQILEDNNYKINTKKIIIYGQSHGAYLGYLCNALAPDMFSLLIDNSAWLLPAYLESSRYLTFIIDKMIVQVEFDYLAKGMKYDKELLYLPFLYKQFVNKCEIRCYHGTGDDLITHLEKKKFCEKIQRCRYFEVSKEDIDGQIFKSNTHGLDADFLKLFEYVMETSTFLYGNEIQFDNVLFQTNDNIYELNYESGMPLLTSKNLIHL